MLQWRIKIKGTRKRHMMAVHLKIEADARHAWHNVQLPEKFMGHNSCKTKHTSKQIIAYYYHGQRKCNQNCLTRTHYFISAFTTLHCAVMISDCSLSLSPLPFLATGNSGTKLHSRACKRCSTLQFTVCVWFVHSSTCAYSRAAHSLEICNPFI